jgi:hypothetical protein
MRIVRLHLRQIKQIRERLQNVAGLALDGRRYLLRSHAEWTPK